MALVGEQAKAILWAQWRALLNFYRRPQMGGYWVGTAVMALWYALLAAAALGLAIILATIKPSDFPNFHLVLTFGFLAAFLYWQVVPVFLASTGMSIDTRRLMVYPIPERQLFGIEVLLRLSTGAEVLIVLAGVFVGLLRNPHIPAWGPPSLLLFVVFNLFVSAGVKDLLARVMERKGVREVAVLILILLMVSPQMIALMGVPPWLKAQFERLDQTYLPWGVAAALAIGQQPGLNLALACFYLILAVFFGRLQFHRNLFFDVDAARAGTSHGGTTTGARWTGLLFHWPRRLFRDPLAALVEKELQALARSSRFRLVFFMGFTFGLVVWLPLAFGRHGLTRSGPIESNFLTWISVYAVIMLGEVALFNSLGFDRSAAQLYWIAPVKLRQVLTAKNIAACVYIILELSIITAVCLLIRLPIGFNKIGEAFAVTLVLAIFFAALGNIGSVYYPRAADPQSSWRNRAGSQFQLIMLLAYPVLAIPVSLAYLARYAFETQMAFYLVLLINAGLGLIFYSVALDTAERRGLERRERILTALTAGEGPIGT